MSLGPKSKSGQLTDILRERLLAGDWSGKLPAERALADEYLVSRSTLRAALKTLENEGLLGSASSTRSGRRLRISVADGKSVEETGRVVLLTPSLQDSPLVVEQLSSLRELLGQGGVQVFVRECKRLTHLKQPRKQLAALAAGYPHSVFVLHKMPQQVQQAACRLKLPAIVFGTVFAEVNLPCVDVDFAAVARHAAGRCLGKGHQKLAVLVHRTSLAGDALIVNELENELDRRGAPAPLVMKHDFNRARLIDALDHHFLAPESRPDALLVGNQHHLLTTMSHLMRRGVQIPRDISLVYLGNDPAAERLSPLPDRYDLGRRMIRRLAISVQSRLSGATPGSHFLLPSMVKGETLQ